APEHAGYIFDRWDGDPTNVTEDRTITACYWMIGDVNHDGEITTYDALLIMRYALGLETEGNELIMDFNGDGCVDSLDALLVLRRSIV
ncbi:MAG: dockerin type I domain-containing protein, partial [Bacilli bacterium]|nr:dockerin type I domain-containing protein [Bacilli bacterium]